jgi:exodeoxyribonuclease-3
MGREWRTVKIVSWNINGIRAAVRNQVFYPFMAAQQPDILCLQETKAEPGQISLVLPSHPYQYWHAADKRGYAGTGVLSVTAPLAVSSNIGVERHDHEGRVLTVEFPAFFVVSVYVPNAKRDLSRLAERQDWDCCLLAYLQTLEQQKPVVCCGDFNVAHTAIDLARPQDNLKTHGFTPEERSGFARFLEAGFIDTFRHLHPDLPGQYTWWRQFGGARQRNIGWRIDYILISAALLPALVAAEILATVAGSDHCPVAVELKI